MKRHREKHFTKRIGWLRAAVLGANDGIISIASLVVGVSAAHQNVVISGIAGLVAGAMSMAAGEYVSVHSQADTEKAEKEREHLELEADPEAEQRELTAIYVGRGLDRRLARRVSEQLTAHDALGAHVRDELGIFKDFSAKPIQAALASATSFTLGGALPLSIAILAPPGNLTFWVGSTSLFCLGVLGAVAAHVGGAKILAGTLRVTLWGALALIATTGIGTALGTIV